MKVARRVVVRQVEQISSLVSLWEVVINFCCTMQWLVNVAKVVYQHPEAK